jgi:hypothetical protein
MAQCNICDVAAICHLEFAGADLHDAQFKFELHAARPVISAAAAVGRGRRQAAALPVPRDVGEHQMFNFRSQARPRKPRRQRPAHGLRRSPARRKGAPRCDCRQPCPNASTRIPRGGAFNFSASELVGMCLFRAGFATPTIRPPGYTATTRQGGLVARQGQGRD